jgi:hypothetical protein
LHSTKREIYTGWTKDQLNVSHQDQAVLRKLAERVANLASSPEMNDKRARWRAINSLQRNRPVIFCDPENGWNEIITTAQMECQGKIARHSEMNLRKEIFWGVTRLMLSIGAVLPKKRPSSLVIKISN